VLGAIMSVLLFLLPLSSQANFGQILGIVIDRTHWRPIGYYLAIRD
jgi:hypothetical protein